MQGGACSRGRPAVHGGGRWRGEKDWKRDKVGFEMNICTNFKYWKVDFSFYEKWIGLAHLIQVSQEPRSSPTNPWPANSSGAVEQ